VAEYLDLLEREGMAVLKWILGNILDYFTDETGTVVVPQENKLPIPVPISLISGVR